MPPVCHPVCWHAAKVCHITYNPLFPVAKHLLCALISQAFVERILASHVDLMTLG